MEKLFKDPSNSYNHSQVIPLYEFRIHEIESKIIDLIDDFNRRPLKEVTKRVVLKAIETCSREIIDFQLLIEKFKKLGLIDSQNVDYDYVNDPNSSSN